MGIGKRIDDNSIVSAKKEYVYELTKPKFTLQDLILPSETWASVGDFLAYKKHENLIFQSWGLAETHQQQRQMAINLYGDSGTGKTLAAHAIANELQRPLLIVDYAAVESKYVGETSKNITQIFNQAKEQQAIIFFDEADAILSRRVTNMTQATDTSVNQTRSVLLTLMNDHDGLIIFTTNFIENYDPAFLRRILAHIKFNLPDVACRELLWRKYIPSNLPHNTNYKRLAEISENLSGSDISNCVLKAALSAARKGENLLDISYFQQAITEIISSKCANLNKSEIKINERIVEESYVKSKIGEQAVEELKL